MPEYALRMVAALKLDRVRLRWADAHTLFVAETQGRGPSSPRVMEELQRLTGTLPLPSIAGHEV